MLRPFLCQYLSLSGGTMWDHKSDLQHDKYVFFYQTHCTCRLIKLFVHVTSFLIHPQEVAFYFLSSSPCLLQSTNMTCLGSSSELHHYAACLLSLGRNQRLSLFSRNKKNNISVVKNHRSVLSNNHFFLNFHPLKESAAHLTSTDKLVTSNSP